MTTFQFCQARLDAPDMPAPRTEASHPLAIQKYNMPMTDEHPAHENVFVAYTPLGFSVRVSHSYWKIITSIKHPVMAGRDLDVKKALEQPDEIRSSQKDPTVYLFYILERKGRWICAVAKKLNGEGFLITAYPTEAIKEGRQIWTR